MNHIEKAALAFGAKIIRSKENEVNELLRKGLFVRAAEIIYGDALLRMSREERTTALMKVSLLSQAVSIVNSPRPIKGYWPKLPKCKK